jgi:hypothetical protein
MEETTTKLESIIEVLQWLKDHDLSDRAAVVGQWVWLEFPDDAVPDLETRTNLMAIGFHCGCYRLVQWTRKRECWQHPCGHDSGYLPH